MDSFVLTAGFDVFFNTFVMIKNIFLSPVINLLLVIKCAAIKQMAPVLEIKRHLRQQKLHSGLY